MSAKPNLPRPPASSAHPRRRSAAQPPTGTPTATFSPRSLAPPATTMRRCCAYAARSAPSPPPAPARGPAAARLLARPPPRSYRRSHTHGVPREEGERAGFVSPPRRDPPSPDHPPPSIRLGRNTTERQAPREKKNTSTSSSSDDTYTCSSMETRCGSSICHESAANDETAHLAKMNRDDVQEESERMIQELNELGLGESITGEEFLNYFHQLPRQPPRPDTKLSDDDQIQYLLIRHALYRLKYYKQAHKTYFDQYDNQLDEDLDVLLDNSECIKEDDSKLSFLQMHRYFQEFENDGTLDWYFHPDYCMLAPLDDYQLIVPWYNVAYLNWEKYRSFLHSYKVDLEYLEYCEELSKKLKWMEDYQSIEMSSPTRNRIRNRGAYQAVKIAAGFSKITVDLAYTGFDECVHGMGYDSCRSKELDVYFGIWQWVTRLKMSLRDAFVEACELNKVPLNQAQIKLLENKDDSSKLKKQFYTFTKGISGEVTDDTALELIALEVKNKWRRPKFYEHYVRKKMDIAQSIGLISRYKIDFIDN